MVRIIKSLLLTNNQILVSEIEEVGADIGEPDCKLIKPFLVTTSEEKITMKDGVMVLKPWLLHVTKETTFMISSDKIMTIANPTPTILKKYEDLTK